MKIGLVKFRFATQAEQNPANNTGIGHESIEITCGGCGKPVHARVLARAEYEELTPRTKGTNLWCLCPCGQPTVIQMQTDPNIQNMQFPRPMEFIAGKDWPADLSRLFHEAALAFSANAFTACAMVSRKILMAVACTLPNVDEGQSFAYYVDKIVTQVLPIPTARASIDKIRTIGNDAVHQLAFVDESDARRAIEIARYVLSAAYSLPAA